MIYFEIANTCIENINTQYSYHVSSGNKTTAQELVPLLDGVDGVEAEVGHLHLLTLHLVENPSQPPPDHLATIIGKILNKKHLPPLLSPCLGPGFHFFLFYETSFPHVSYFC